MTNRTKLKKYHELDFTGLLTILKKNTKKIPRDVTARDFRERLKIEFEKSLAVLTPLKNDIELTDRLIDQVVYKLYGLTEEEIKIVEGAVG